MGPEPTAARLVATEHLLRALVHVTASAIEREPRFEVKCLLADHLHDDSEALAAVHARANELHPATRAAGHPAAATIVAGDLDLTHGRAKPALADALEQLASEIDALADEPTLRLVTRIAHDQRRHADEIRTTDTHPPLTLDLTESTATPTPLPVLPPLARPARDAYLEEDPQADPTTLHALVHDRLCTAEAAARAVHERPDAMAAQTAQLARAAWDAARHARALERLMAQETGTVWGQEPIAFGLDVSYRAPAGRIAEILSASDPQPA